MTERFQPHRYASALKASGDYGTDGGVLYRWRGTHWDAMVDDAACRDAYHWLVEHDVAFASHANASRAVDTAKLWVPQLPSPSDQVVIPCTNGYAYPASGAWRLGPVDKGLGLRHCLDCVFEPECRTASKFETFLRQILPDPAVRERVQEYVGYSLMADARHQRAQLWLGSGANGKGVLANIVQRLHRRTAAVRLNALEGFALSECIGASLIFVDEVPRASINESLIKSLIAAEKIAIDRKYQSPISVNLHAKWLVLGNTLPLIRDHSVGFWRRWDIVPFTVTVPEADRDSLLAETIIGTELPGVLNWALEGLLRLQERGRFGPMPPAMDAAMRAGMRTAQREGDSVKAWFEGNAVGVCDALQLKKKDVYGHYQGWCDSQRLLAAESEQFWKAVRKLARDFREGRPRQDGAQTRMCNLRIATD